MFLTFLILFRQPFNFNLKDGSKNYITQKLDHFDSHSSAEFSQLYYVYQTKPGTTPESLVFYFGSEDVPNVDFSYSAIQYAQQTNSTLFALEHRFFGTSYPKGNEYKLTKDSLLQYLTIPQVLNDMAVFINKMKNAFCETCPITLFGGGYLGAIASWFHVKYPHLSTHVVSSSSPIFLNQTLPSYDENVYNIIKSIDSNCLDRITKILNSDPNKDLIYVLAESVSNSILYSSTHPNLINNVCSNLDEETTEDLKIALEYSNKELDDTFESLDYNSYTNTSLESEYRDYRSWMWLKCNEIGLWHTTSSNPTIHLRPNTISEDFFNNICLTLFDKQMTVLDSYNYGKDNIIGTNTIFINAQDDPMRRTFITDNNTMIRRFSFNFEDCSRFDDLANVQSGQIQRETAFSQLNDWINEERNHFNCKHGVRVFGKCRCDEHYAGDSCQHLMHPEKSFKFITILSVAVPTILLLVIGGGVWFCGKREDNEIGARPTLYT